MPLSKWNVRSTAHLLRQHLISINTLGLMERLRPCLKVMCLAIFRQSLSIFPLVNFLMFQRKLEKWGYHSEYIWRRPLNLKPLSSLQTNCNASTNSNNFVVQELWVQHLHCRGLLGVQSWLTHSPQAGDLGGRYSCWKHLHRKLSVPRQAQPSKSFKKKLKCWFYSPQSNI